MIEHKVYIIIVTYNGEQWIKACLKSIINNGYKKYEIILVDNASRDNTLHIAKEIYNEIFTIKLNKNIGYGSAANLGIKYSLKKNARYIMILNQDIKLAKHCINNLLKIYENMPEAGIVSPFQYDYNGLRLDYHFKKIVWQNIDFQNDILHDKKFKLSYETFNVIGAAILFKGEVFKRVGLFDPIFFLYHEERDLCRRAIYHGYKIYLVPEAKICHWHMHIYPERMKLRSSLSSFYGYHFYLIKNPFNSVQQNLISVLKELKKWSFIKRNIFAISKRTILSILMIVIIAIYLPLLIRKRKTDMKPCIFH